MPKGYLIAIAQHTQECLEDLNELSRLPSSDLSAELNAAPPNALCRCSLRPESAWRNIG
jgi:hypothetical protein